MAGENDCACDSKSVGNCRDQALVRVLLLPPVKATSTGIITWPCQPGGPV